MSENQPIVACIGGSFANELISSGALAGEKLGQTSTPFGVSSTIYKCRLGESSFYLLPRHWDGSVPAASTFVNHRANIYALKELGTSQIIAWSAAWAVAHTYRIGEFVLVDDLIDETRGRANTFFEHGALVGMRQWPVFCPTVRSSLAKTLEALGVKHHQGGTYVCTEGPRRETPAEVRKYVSWGAGLLGYSLAPEVFLAKELQMCYASLCFVVDFAETGSDYRPFESGWLFDQFGLDQDVRRAQDAMEQIPGILEAAVASLPTHDVRCDCANGLQKLLKDGMLDGDFRRWFDVLRPAAELPPKGSGL